MLGRQAQHHQNLMARIACSQAGSVRRRRGQNPAGHRQPGGQAQGETTKGVCHHGDSPASMGSARTTILRARNISSAAARSAEGTLST